MSALDTATVRCTVWQLTLLARLIARHPLPWVLAQDVVALTAEERLLLVEMLGAWEVGMRLRGEGTAPYRDTGEKARGP